MSNLKSTSLNHNEYSVSNEPSLVQPTIMQTFERVLGVVQGSSLTEECMKKIQPELNYLSDRLQVNSHQVVFLASLIEYANPMSLMKLAAFLGIKNIRMLSFAPELRNLVNRRFLRKGNDRYEKVTTYQIRQEVLNSYLNNEGKLPNLNARLNLEKMIERLNELFILSEDDDVDVAELEFEIKDILKSNPRHNICKLIKKYAVQEQILFLFCCCRYVTDGDTNVEGMQYRGLFNGLHYHTIYSQLASGKYKLIQDGLLVYSATRDISSREGITVNEEVRNQLKEALGLNWEENEENYSKRGLTLKEDIVGKALFFNPEEEVAIHRLNDLLQEKNYQRIRQRLSAHGMRQGFACLFYGAPGTGKTESVLQLAKSTGRDVMMVNISQVKSKWVGETEKNIKSIFDRYRMFCTKCAMTPILLFNEADAIISNRNAHVDSSVDKMENAMQNIILEEIEKLDGILIATTNLTSNMDTAFERRFIYKIEFHKPILSVKTRIWQSMLHDLPKEDAEVLSAKYDFSGGQIENIVRKQMVDSILYDNPLCLKSLDEYCQMEQIHKDTRRSVVGFR